MSTKSVKESRGSYLADAARELVAAASKSSFDVTTFFEKFELLAETPKSVEHLRQFILCSAVQGKLIRQNTNDEPAPHFVRRIKAEKDLLQRSGVIKERTAVKPVESREELFEIPDSWTWVRAAEICYPISSGTTPTNSVFRESSCDAVPYLKVYNIRNQKIDFEYKPQFIDQEHHLTKMKRCILIPGTVLLNIVGPPLGKTAIVPNTFPEWSCNQAIAFFRLIGDGSANYLHLYFKSGLFLRDIALIGTAGQDNISVSKCKNIVIPLPPLAEQKRIVAKVDELMGLCDRLEALEAERKDRHASLSRAAIARFAAAPTPTNLQFLFHKSFDVEATDLRQTILSMAVRGKLVPQMRSEGHAESSLGEIRNRTQLECDNDQKRRIDRLEPIDTHHEPFILPTGWTWARFPELGKFGRGKSRHRPRNAPQLYSEGTYPLVQTGDVARANGWIETYSNLYNEIGLAQSRLWPRGTMCITIAANIADSGLLSMDACIPDSVVGFIPDAVIGEAKYFEYFMRTAKSRLEDFAPSTAQKNINLAILDEVLIPFPPPAEQKRIVAKVDELMALVDQLEQQLTHSRTLGLQLLEAVVANLTAT